MPSDHLRGTPRLRRQRAGCGRMVSEGESAIEAFRLVRELGASADDGGTRKILDVSGTLRSENRQARSLTGVLATAPLPLIGKPGWEHSVYQGCQIIPHRSEPKCTRGAVALGRSARGTILDLNRHQLSSRLLPTGLLGQPSLDLVGR